MDTQNFDTNAGFAALAQVHRSIMVVGAKQLKKAVQGGHAIRVYLARNADPAITEPIEAMCLRLHIECAWVPSMLDLGKACGIEVGAAAAAAVR